MAVEHELSLEVGGEVGAGILSTFAIRGRKTIKAQLKRDQDVHVVLTDADGEVVFSAYGSVTGVNVKTVENRGVCFTERAHTIRISDESGA